MKTSFVISSVFAAHVAVIGGALLIQGCGTTRGPVELPAEGSMPPVIKPEPPKCVKTPVVKPTPAVTPQAKKWNTTDISSYTVGKGDTMSGIAHRYGVSVAEIMALNNISNQNKIIVGQKLAIPGKISESKSVKKSTSVKRSSVPVPAGGNVYVVQSGDCLSVIAHKAGVSVQSIRDANSLKNDVIYVGKKLVIPGGKTIPVKKKAPVTSVPHVKKQVKHVVEDSPIPDADAAPVIDAADFPLPDLAPELPVSSGTVQYHTVKPGQTILDVVSEFNVSIADLRRANNLTSDLLTPGQKLIIPTTE